MSTGYVYLIYQLILIKGDMWGTSETKGTAIGVVCLWERLSAAKIALVVGEGDTPKKLNKTGQSKIKVAGLRPRAAPDFLFRRHKKSAKTKLALRAALLSPDGGAFLGRRWSGSPTDGGASWRGRSKAAPDGAARLMGRELWLRAGWAVLLFIRLCFPS